jgi:hypothetical protein
MLLSPPSPPSSAYSADPDVTAGLVLDHRRVSTASRSARRLRWSVAIRAWPWQPPGWPRIALRGRADEGDGQLGDEVAVGDAVC